LIQVAELTSVYGVSFALVLGNVTLVQLLHMAKRHTWRAIVLPCVLAISCLIIVGGFGMWRLQGRWGTPAAGAAEVGDFRSGEAYTVMAVPQGRFGVSICFEVIFPELVRPFVRHGAQFLVNITNDAWFGDSPASYQHLSMVVFRAVENRVPIVRAANTGISAVIDPTGRLLQQTDLFVRTWIAESIMPTTGPATFYTRYGDLFAYSCLLLTALALGWGMSQRFRQPCAGNLGEPE
jgi:apolipoprotein N-acyltransferase